jgi:hypothetical protein
MSPGASRVLCFDPEIGTGSSNWVIFKDHFVFAEAAAGLGKHIDGMPDPSLPVFTLCEIRQVPAQVPKVLED